MASSTVEDEMRLVIDAKIIDYAIIYASSFGTSEHLLG